MSQNNPLIIALDHEPGGLALLHLSGSLDTLSFTSLRDTLEPLAQEGASPKLIVDLTDVGFVASRGWALLLSTCARIKARGGRMVLCGMNTNLARVFETAKLGHFVPAFTSFELARSAMQDDQPDLTRPDLT